MKTLESSHSMTAPLAENVTNDATRIVTEAMLQVGDNIAQGDLYFVRIAKIPKSAKPRNSRQLAEGDTQGSRHVCEVGEVCDCKADDVSKAVFAASGCTVDPKYCGPVFSTKEGRAYVGHPEHGDHEFVGDMVIATCFQRSLDAEEREQRVID